MGVGGGDGVEERGGVKGAGVEEVGRFCSVRTSAIVHIDAGTGVRTSAGFEGVCTEGKDVGGKA